MDFLPVRSGSDTGPLFGQQQTYHILLQPGDVYVLLGEARYQYKHGIAFRVRDVLLDAHETVRKAQRETRVSITFRRMREASALRLEDSR